MNVFGDYKYSLQVRDNDNKNIWTTFGNDPKELIQNFKDRFHADWRFLWAALFDQNNLLNTKIKRRNKARFVAD